MTETIKYPKGKNPNSLRNLRPVQKGAPTLNPNGRPTKASRRCFTDALMLILEEGWVDPKDNKVKLRAAYPSVPNVLVLAAVNRARENSRDFELLWDRVEGKVLQTIGGQDGEPIRYEISVRDAETRELTDRLLKGGSVVSNISLS